MTQNQQDPSSDTPRALPDIPPRRRCFAGNVRAAISQAVAAGVREIDLALLAKKLDLVSDTDKRPLYQAISDMRKRGEVARQRPGVYTYIGPKAIRQSAKKDVMWRVLRARRVVTVADLVELAAVSEAYAKEWLNMLTGHGVIRRIGARFQMVEDPGPQGMPTDQGKADKLRKIRVSRQRALEELARAEASLAIAKLHIMGLPETDPANEPLTTQGDK